VARAPHDPLAQYQLGFTLDKMSAYDWTGRTWDRSLRRYEEARRLGLNDEKLFTQMAMLEEKKGRYARCTELGELALRIFPESADMLGNVAYWYSVRGANLTRGLELADRAVALVPTHPFYLWDRGLVLEQLGRYREALAAMRAALPRLHLVVDGPASAPELKRDIERVRRLAKGG
jgi:tetratricopeptide (TPR) repeat protein